MDTKKQDVTPCSHKAAEKALRDSERWLATLMANLPGMAYRCQNRPDWPMDFVSEGCASLTGWPASALLQNRPSYGELIVEADRQPVWDAVQEALKDRRPYEFTYRIQTAGGQLRWVWERGCGVFAPEGSLLYLEGFITDITERKRAEKKLLEAEKLLELFFAQSLDGFFFMMLDEPIQWDDNVDKDETLEYVFTHQRVTKVNDAMLAQYGATREQYLGLTPDVLFAHDKDYGKRLWRELFDAGHLHIDSDERKFDGTQMWIEGDYVCLYDEAGRITGHFGIQRDITERKQAEAEVQRLTMAIEQTGDAIVVTDPEGAIQYVNPAFEAVTGYTRREVLNKNPRLLKSGKQDEAFYRNLWETIKSGRIWQGRIINKRKDGGLYTEDTTISPVKDHQGGIVSFVAVKRNITEHLRISEEKARLQEELYQSQKMESIGRLAGGVAHDFNNMLNVILGYGDIILQKLHPDDPLRGDVEEMLKAGRRSADLTRQLLAFSRKQILQPKVLNLNEVVANIEKMLRRLIGEDIALELSLSKNLPNVKVDPGKVEQAIVNLAVNARDAMPMGGRLLIETSEIELDEAYAESHHGAVPGKYVMLSVSDTGCGMEKEVVARIFDPFFTTKEKGKGTGLGLATVYGIIKQSGGDIQVYSEPGKGTTFKLYLPATCERAEAPAREAAHEEPPADGGARILVVEDEEALRGLLGEILAKFGYEVTLAANGGEALLLVEEQGLKPDLVITDMVMPGLTGSALSERLRRKHPGLKVLFMSGYTEDTIIHDGALDPGTPFIQKPFTIRGIAEKVREVLRKK
jgi:PAS domain S-box-containing protein